ncbi:hypothetical protein CCACVL1_19848 [Corchorus capsularis]|uniref:Uncharacterized protein n=1 Tax=Corchorus capsularis TaxID=210143 RepID=A0A1R3HEH4_COCAP|nr:hypothetical protein CCACVL1_19848 [Corchorus capsularis]
MELIEPSFRLPNLNTSPMDRLGFQVCYSSFLPPPNASNQPLNRASDRRKLCYTRGLNLHFSPSSINRASDRRKG